MGMLKPGPVLLRTGFKGLNLLGSLVFYSSTCLISFNFQTPYKLVLLPLFHCCVSLLIHLRQLDKVLLSWKCNYLPWFYISFNIILFYIIMFLR